MRERWRKERVKGEVQFKALLDLEEAMASRHRHRILSGDMPRRSDDKGGAPEQVRWRWRQGEESKSGRRRERRRRHSEKGKGMEKEKERGKEKWKEKGKEMEMETEIESKEEEKRRVLTRPCP